MANASGAANAGIRYTEAAGRIMQVAQQVARGMQWGEIRTEHLLVAAVTEQEGHAARALKALGVSSSTVTATVEEMLGPGRGAPAGELPYTPRSRRVLTETSLAAAKVLGHDQVGSAHILLALISEDHAALQVLYRLGVSADSVRDEVALLLGIPAIPALHSTASNTTEAAPGSPTPAGAAAPTAPTPAHPGRAIGAPARPAINLPLAPGVLGALLQAHEEAQQRQHTMVIPAHLLLALLAQPELNGLATALAEHGLTPAALAERLFERDK